MSGGNLPALQRTVLDLVHEYEDKAAYIPKAIADYDAAHDRIGLTKEGQPRHPLYLPKSAQPLPFSGAKL